MSISKGCDCCTHCLECRNTSHDRVSATNESRQIVKNYIFEPDKFLSVTNHCVARLVGASLSCGMPYENHEILPTKRMRQLYLVDSPISIMLFVGHSVKCLACLLFLQSHHHLNCPIFMDVIFWGICGFEAFVRTDTFHCLRASIVSILLSIVPKQPDRLWHFENFWIGLYCVPVCLMPAMSRFPAHSLGETRPLIPLKCMLVF